MNIHKINPNSQEHQSFLAQNRKDPITGDSISEGDEVVFCVGCKSVFLKDTWEYLGNRHCEQRNTLKIFPNSSKLDLSTKDNILFYKSCFFEKNLIKEQLKSILWKHKKKKVLNYILYNNPILFLPVIIVFFTSVIYFRRFGIIITFFFAIFILLIAKLEQRIKVSKLTTVYKNFKEHVFYISRIGVGFSSPYGFEEFILPLHNIESLKFRFSYLFFDSDYCSIKDINGSITNFPIQNYLHHDEELFLKALDTLNKDSIISIQIEIKDDSIIYERINSVVIKKGYTISICKI